MDYLEGDDTYDPYTQSCKINMLGIEDGRYKQLLGNHEQNPPLNDLFPVVKLSVDQINCVWLIAKIDVYDTRLCYGLCDTGNGKPELCYFDCYNILWSQEPDFSLSYNLDFKAEYPITVYAEAAREFSRITDDPERLRQAALRLN